MERLTHSIKVLWRSERLLVGNDLRLGSHKIMFKALAGLVAVFGLAMLGVAFFFALVPYMGHALAALTVGGVDLALAAILVAYAGGMKQPPEVEMIRDMRDAALSDIEDEVSQAEADLVSLKNDVRRVIRHPAEVLLPGAVGPLVHAIVRGVTSARK